MSRGVSRLRKLKTAHELTNAQLAELAGVSEKTVESWLAKDGAASHRRMPDRALELIELKLSARQVKRRRPAAR